MPWIGVLDGKKVIPEAVETGTIVQCPDCDVEMFPRGPMSDGRARHFVHKSESSGGGGHCGGGEGESDLHRRYKNHAVSRLRTLYEGQYRLASPEVRLGVEEVLPSGVDRRDADALLEFDDPSPKLGRGVIVEVQYRNDSKDIEAVERDYLSLGYSIVWADPSDFTQDRCTLEVDDIVDRVVPVWPNAVPTSKEWHEPTESNFNLRAFRQLNSQLLRHRRSNMDPAARKVNRTYRDYANQAFHGSDVGRFSVPRVPATLPTEFIDGIALDIFRAQPWDSLFDPPTDYTDIWCFAKVPATLPPEWHSLKQNEFWNNEPWEARFSGVFTFDSTAAFELKVDCPFHEFLTDSTSTAGKKLVGELRHAWFNGRQQGPDDEPDPPPNPFDDVQCRYCGTYWSIRKQHKECPSCGSPVDYDWNIAAGRISSEAYDELY